MSSASETFSRWRPTLAEVDLRAFDRNVDAILGRIPRDSKMVAVLKANGYGHGAVALAKRVEGRAVAIAVAILEEALELRRAGIRAPILLLGPLTPPQFDLVFENDITPGIVGPEELAGFAERAHASGWSGGIHIKLDSGMGRMGFVPEDLDGLAATLSRLSRVRVEGIYTHFANASDPADPYTEIQLARFDEMRARLRSLGVTAPLHHAANSAAIMRGLVQPGDWVRAGIVLYGAEPLDDGSARLEPLLRWTTRIARLKELPSGSPIGYGCSFRTARASRIATLPVGYADGYPRSLSNRAEVLIRGSRAPVVGRVSMDLITVDVTGVPGAAAGDPVVLLGTDGGEEISAEELAGKLGTISYEILCGVSARVPRVYRDGETLILESRFLSSGMPVPDRISR